MTADIDGDQSAENAGGPAATEPAKAAPTDPPFYDVASDLDFGIFKIGPNGIAIFVLVSVIVILIIASVLGPKNVGEMLVIALPICLVMLLAAILLHISAVRAVEGLIADSTLSSFDDLVPAVFRSTWIDGVTRTRTFVRLMAQEDRFGVTIRVGPSKLAASPVPLVLPFEPVPLDESTAQFGSLEAQAPATLSTESVATTRVEGRPGRHIARRRFHRGIVLSGGWSVVAIFAFNAAVAGFRSLTTSRFTADFAIWLALLLLFVVGLTHRGAWRPFQQWFLVPGAMVSRRASPLQHDWNVHLFERSNSVLAVYRRSRHIWEVHVADADRHEKTQMTYRETQLLLRAWLSPLPPPCVEQLSDLG